MLLHWTFIFCNTHSLSFGGFFSDGDSTEDLKRVTYIELNLNISLEESGHSLSRLCTKKERDVCDTYLQ